MNILMIYPEMPRTIGKFEHMANLAGRKSAFPPIGLLTIAAMLPENWNKKVIDLNTDPLTNIDLEWADYAFVSAMNVQARSSKEVIGICNKANVPVVAGGPLFTHEYEKFQGVAHFILNEGEITLPLFLEDLKKGEAKHIYETDKYADTHTTPAPLWELVDVNKYLYAVIQYSRGCPYLCDFCDVTALFGRVPRTKTVEQIIGELDTLMASGKNEMIFFADDNLIGNKNLLKKELLPALIEWRGRNKYAPAFSTQLTINIVDDEDLMQLMLEAGFRHILIGIESIDEASLIQMKKKQNSRRNILENMKYLHARGFVVIGTFIVGLDTDRPDVFQNVVNFIQESGIVLVVVNVLKAPPGTELFDRMVKENRLLESFEFDEDRTNIIPIMDPDELHNGYKKVLEGVYSPQSVYERVVKFYESKEPNKVKYPLNRKVNAKDVYNFLRIIVKLGFIDKNRKYFWKMFMFTAKYNINYIDLTILFALLMHQYQILLDGFLEKEKRGVFIYSDKLKQKKLMSA